MDLLADVESYLISKGIVSILYRDFMPDVPETVATVYEYSGELPEPQIAGAYRPLQFVTRDPNPVVSRQKCLDICKAFMTEDGILYLNPERWCTVQVKQMPFKLKQDQQGRVLYVFNLAVTTYID